MKIMMTITFAIVLTFYSGFAKANSYTEAVLGHVIQSTMNGTNIDEAKMMESELQRLGYKFTIDSINVLQKYLPNVLDSVASELRQQSDQTYKCALLKGTNIEDDLCQ